MDYFLVRKKTKIYFSNIQEVLKLIVVHYSFYLKCKKIGDTNFSYLLNKSKTLKLIRFRIEQNFEDKIEKNLLYLNTEKLKRLILRHGFYPKLNVEMCCKLKIIMIKSNYIR